MVFAEREIPAAALGTWIRWCPVRRPYGPPEQFAAGRSAAAAALAAAGSAGRAVPRGPGGRPCFPPGFPGSVAHTSRTAVALVAPGALAAGVDIEDAVISPRVARFVLRERERRTLLRPAGKYTPRDLFAAKEAAFKALAGAPLDDFLFWHIELSQSGGSLTASYREISVPVWVWPSEGFSFAVAIQQASMSIIHPHR